MPKSIISKHLTDDSKPKDEIDSRYWCGREGHAGLRCTSMDGFACQYKCDYLYINVYNYISDRRMGNNCGP